MAPGDTSTDQISRDTFQLLNQATDFCPYYSLDSNMSQADDVKVIAIHPSTGRNSLSLIAFDSFRILDWGQVFCDIIHNDNLAASGDT
jgi:hypothetical protein